MLRGDRRMHAHTNEWVDLIDDKDRVHGRVSRAQMRRDNLWHRSVDILCMNSRGEIYVHRRTKTKDVFPGLYDMFVGGVVGAGEAYDAAATREIAEELGIVGAAPERLFQHRYDGPSSKAVIAVYRVVWDGPIKHQPSEVAWGQYCSAAQIEANRDGWAFVPDGLEVFRRYLAQLRD